MITLPTAITLGCDSHSVPTPRRRGASPSPPEGRRFPDGFRWGVATSAYQIEGAVKADGRGQSIWDAFCAVPGRISGGDTGEQAADHYHRYLTDLDIMQSLGVQTYRFSIAWPRIQPDGRGSANQRGLDFYKRLVDGLLERGIEPLATLYHWDLPQALQETGGWEQRDTAQRFADYAAIMFEALGSSVPTWATINEPKTIAEVGYVSGFHAPGKRDPEAAWAVRHHLLLAHGLAVRAFRDSGRARRICPVLNLAPVYPADDASAGSTAVAVADAMENRIYLDPIFKGSYPQDLLADQDKTAALHRVIKDGDLNVIAAPVDLLGVNYYNPVYVDTSGTYVMKHPTSMATWQQLYPDGLHDVLLRVRQDYGDIPISITENGIPTDDAPDGTVVYDPERIEFLRTHLAAVHRAIEDGVGVESYYLWSLLDNFEWSAGYSQRWGIVYVDFDSQQRIPKDSAQWYQDTIARNGI
ncbi:MAG: beta-glucosidase [Dactylosporangium sp.]|nr:beta-glucosidase [Dactylosporangium sp.]NNJ60605.1 beta-glucosidase [Dactylosporangium sp.]